MNNMAMGIVLIAGGVWLTQDSIASILYYLGKENWHYNQAVRLARAVWGIAFIVIGIIQLGRQ